jgi:hypothetical protein
MKTTILFNIIISWVWWGPLYFGYFGKATVRQESAQASVLSGLSGDKEIIHKN